MLRPYTSELRPSTSGADRKSTRLNSSHSQISYPVFCLKNNALRVAIHGRRARMDEHRGTREQLEHVGVRLRSDEGPGGSRAEAPGDRWRRRLLLHHAAN